MDIPTKKWTLKKIKIKHRGERRDRTLFFMISIMFKQGYPSCPARCAAHLIFSTSKLNPPTKTYIPYVLMWKNCYLHVSQDRIVRVASDAQGLKPLTPPQFMLLGFSSIMSNAICFSNCRPNVFLKVGKCHKQSAQECAARHCVHIGR
jgi:hypothetical protein